MSQERIELDERDLFLLGVLAEPAQHKIIRFGKLPRGCDDSQALELVQSGYLESAPHYTSDGQLCIEYKLTPRGLDAWRTCGFTHPPAQKEK
jgi:hypothetical protein